MGLPRRFVIRGRSGALRVLARLVVALRLRGRLAGVFLGLDVVRARERVGDARALTINLVFFCFFSLTKNKMI